jgi:hypothetical protein
MEIRTNLKSQRWGSESSRTDGLVDTCIYKQVAMAKLSTKQNPIGVCTKSWQPLQLSSIVQSESNIKNMLDLDYSSPCTKSDMVAWWRTLGRLGLGPQSISLVLRIFHVISTHGFIQSSNSENENATKS